MNTTCAQCGIPIIVTKRVKERNFCSRGCGARWWAAHPSDAMRRRADRQRIRSDVPCAGCGKGLALTPSRIKRVPTGNYCSQSCMMIHKLTGKFGPDHPGWKGGIARYPKSFRSMRLLAMERDCFSCQWDGPHDGALRLEVHHLNGQRHDNRMENLVTLCSRCHQRYHRNHPATIQEPVILNGRR